jgi:hypothetical protein
MAEVERRVYVYGMEMHDGEWNRADVLRALAALQGDDQLLELGSETYAWALVDRVPTMSQTGQLRFSFATAEEPNRLSHRGRVFDLNIPDDAGLVERPTLSWPSR